MDRVGEGRPHRAAHPVRRIPVVHDPSHPGQRTAGPAPPQANRRPLSLQRRPHRNCASRPDGGVPHRRALRPAIRRASDGRILFRPGPSAGGCLVQRRTAHSPVGKRLADLSSGYQRLFRFLWGHPPHRPVRLAGRRGRVPSCRLCTAIGAGGRGGRPCPAVLAGFGHRRLLLLLYRPVPHPSPGFGRRRRNRKRRLFRL